MRTRLIIILATFVTMLLPTPPAGAAPSLKIMIVSTGDAKRATDFQTLLCRHGLNVVILPWEKAGVETAKKFDLVMITGAGRRISASQVIKGYGCPVLGIGPYGCKYFSLLKLKHGHPYT